MKELHSEPKLQIMELDFLQVQKIISKLLWLTVVLGFNFKVCGDFNDQRAKKVVKICQQFKSYR